MKKEIKENFYWLVIDVGDVYFIVVRTEAFQSASL